MSASKTKKSNATVNNLLKNAERVEKLSRLMKDHGIEQGDDFSLLMLAADHIPGFRLKLKHGDYGAVMRDQGGRGTDWTLDKLDELVTAVDDAKRIPEISTDDAALRHIAKRGKWARPPNRDLNKWIKTLKNTLAIARRIQRDSDRLLAQAEQLGERIPKTKLD